MYSDEPTLEVTGGFYLQNESYEYSYNNFGCVSSTYLLLFYPFKIQPIRITFDKGSTYVFNIFSSGLTKIIKCDVKDLDLDNENNFININKDESRIIFISGTDRRFINCYANKLRYRIW